MGHPSGDTPLNHMLIDFKSVPFNEYISRQAKHQHRQSRTGLCRGIADLQAPEVLMLPVDF
jgi:hypothetical protein